MTDPRLQKYCEIINPALVGCKAIPLTQGMFAIVDDADYDDLMKYSWQYADNGYAKRLKRVGEEGGRKNMMMHRQIMNTPQGMETDHINGNGLDNRRCNLRVCTNNQNQCNRRKQVEPLSSPYKGVYWCKRGKAWIAQYMMDKKNRHIGSYPTALEAAIAYNTKVKEVFGEFARLNDVVIPDGYKPKEKHIPTSKYKGVHLHKPSGKWAAKITAFRKYHWLGFFDTELEAAQVYNEAAVKLNVPHKCYELNRN